MELPSTMQKPNSRSSHLLAALLLIPLGIGGSAAGCELDEVSYTTVESECLTLLRTLRDPRAPGPQEVANSIGQLGLGTLEELFVILCRVNTMGQLLKCLMACWRKFDRFADSP